MADWADIKVRYFTSFHIIEITEISVPNGVETGIQKASLDHESGASLDQVGSSRLLVEVSTQIIRTEPGRRENHFADDGGVALLAGLEKRLHLFQRNAVPVFFVSLGKSINEIDKVLSGLCPVLT